MDSIRAPSTVRECALTLWQCPGHDMCMGEARHALPWNCRLDSLLRRQARAPSWPVNGIVTESRLSQVGPVAITRGFEPSRWLFRVH